MRLVLLAVALLLAAAAPAGAVERILRFVSDVTIERSGDLMVTETIRVQAEGNVIKRGILRDFPTSYRRGDQSPVQVAFDVRSVTRDGAAENFATEWLANGVRLRIGRADTQLTTGPHEYVIVYRTNRQIGFFPSYDELYWNATGTGWTFPIDVAEARITLPDAVPFGQPVVYTGPQGARGKDAAVVEQRPGRIVFRTTRPLPAGNGLTVSAAWPKGVVAAPTDTQKAEWWLRDNALPVAAMVGLALVLGYYALAWLWVGRDPPRGTIIPLFGPPDGMSAAAARFIHRMGFDNKAFTAAILDLAVRGHLRMVDQGKTVTLEQRTGGRAIEPAERTVASKLFTRMPQLPLVQSNHSILTGARDALKQAYEQAFVGRLFTDNTGWAVVGFIVAAMVSIVVVVWTCFSYPEQQAGPLLIGMLLPVPATIAGALLIRAGWHRSSLGSLFVIGGALLALVGVTFGVLVLVGTVSHPSEALAGIVPLIVVPIAVVGFSWLKAPTREGRRVIDAIDGFRQYLGVAEESRLAAYYPPEKTPELFERFLPYAVALDVENAWAARFAGVLATAAAGAAAMAWYSGQYDVGRDPVGFADRMGGSLSQTVAAAATAPGSTDSGGGSSGGGSSGGGGGGGGGSGW